MDIVDIINKKEAGEELTKEEIDFVVTNYLNDSIKDYQMSSLLMSICIKGMSFDETYNLTTSMLNSGEKIDLSSIDGIKVDKHSTGGVGDKTTLVVAPIVASCSVPVAKMSGRGLGFTGGTIDKLESISGFKTTLTNEEFIKQVNNIKISIISQTNNIDPADKKIYALRDVTGTTESIPLISSSIMSKKLASGSDKILLDVKVGKGAFMQNIDDAKKLAKTMVDIGNKYGKETIAILSNMDYPLGYTIGNSLEVKEAMNVLRGNGEKRFTDLCLLLSAYMVSMGKNISIDDAIEEVKENYSNGKALDKFKEFVNVQQGDINNIPIEKNIIEIYSDKEGYINDIDTLMLAEYCNGLGAGRKTKEDNINPKVGIELVKTIHQKVEKNDLLMKVYTSSEIDIKKYLETIVITNEKKEETKIVYEIIK